MENYYTPIILDAKHIAEKQERVHAIIALSPAPDVRAIPFTDGIEKIIDQKITGG